MPTSVPSTTVAARVGAVFAVVVATALVACTPDPPSPASSARPVATGVVVEQPPDDRCDRDERYVEQRITGGARWRFCWTVEAVAGPVLRNLAYAPPGDRPWVDVLAETRLAEVYMVYDNGNPRGFDTDTGFGAVKTLEPAECAGGTVHASPVTFGRGALCVAVTPAGYSHVQAQEDDGYLLGEELTVFAVAKVEWYSYVIRWTLRDDGSVAAGLGASGTLRPDSVDDHDHDHGSPLGPGSTRVHTSHFHHAVWRMRFPPRASYRVEQVDVARRPDDTYPTRRSVRPTEFAADYSGSRSWQVVAPGVTNADGHPAAWELPSQAGTGFVSDHPDERFLRHDVHLTRHHDCERLVRAAAGCTGTLDRYVDGEPLTDPVLWVGVGFHHIPRDEDADPMPVHWQGFTLFARDVQDRNGLGRR